MIIHRFAVKKGLVILTPEDVDDLWCLRRVIGEGDLVSGETTRVIKNKGVFSRPDKGERIRVHLTLRVEKLRLDNELGRLRASGTIVEASDEMLPKGSHHSLTVTLGNRLAMKKDRFSSLEKALLTDSQRSEAGSIIIAVDRREAAMGIVKGTHLQLLSTVESGQGGKQYPIGKISFTSYYDKIIELIESIYEPGQKIYAMGPGETKKALVNYLRNRTPHLADVASVLEGVDLAGQDGVYSSIHSSKLREALRGSKIAHVAELLNEVVRRISRADSRVAFTFKDTRHAAELGAVDSSLVSDGVFQLGVEEEELVKLLNLIEIHGGKSYLVDASTDLGSQVSKFGGIVALLRYPVS